MAKPKEKVSNEITIVELQPESWRRYKKIRLEALHYEPSAFANSYREARGRTEKEWRGYLKEVNRKNAHLKLFFAERAGTLVGMIGVEFDLRDKRLHVAKLYQVYVQQESRGRGIGKMLLEHVLKYVKKNVKRIKKIALAVNKTQLPAVKMYQSMGFEIVGLQKMEIKIHGYYIDQYIMEKYF